MSYTAMKACWDDVRDAADTEVVAALRAHAPALELTGDPAAATAPATGAPHVLIVAGVDHDAVVLAWMVPADRVDDQLRDALAAIDGRVFAGGADLEPDQWDAAVRVLAALAFELADADELAVWAEDDGASVDADELAALWDRWRDTGVRAWADLARPITQVCRFRRAM